MATRTVAESREERKESAKEALRAAMSKFAAAELAAANASDRGDGSGAAGSQQLHWLGGKNGWREGLPLA